MIESLENTLQIVVLVICAGISLYRAVAGQSRLWTIAVFFFGSWLLGDIYWLACLLFYDSTPQISIISDLSWYASYIFLYLLLIRTAPLEAGMHKRFIVWIGPVLAALLAIFFMQWGEVLSNLIYASLMGLLMYAAIGRMANKGFYRKQFFLTVLILIFCLLEYGLWISSCFWHTETLANPYYWFDFLLTASFLIFLRAIRKAVSE